MSIVFSCVIPASKKDAESQMLKDLIASIRAQDFPQDQIEILVITEGDSESAKAIGIRRAKGEICAMFCADNYLIDKTAFSQVYKASAFNVSGIYSKHYAVNKNDNSLNRYFSLMGNNDPIAFYLNKSDRRPYYEMNSEERFVCMDFFNRVPSLGDNGFFFSKKILDKANIDNYYPMDAAEDLRKQGWCFYIRLNMPYIWHRTSDNLISFLIKRYKYARDLYCERTDRRWRMIDTNEDKLKLIWFIISTITIFPCLLVSIRGFTKIKDFAWFYHFPVCLGFLITYTLLAIRNLFKHGVLFQKRPSLSPV